MYFDLTIWFYVDVYVYIQVLRSAGLRGGQNIENLSFLVQHVFNPFMGRLFIYNPSPKDTVDGKRIPSSIGPFRGTTRTDKGLVRIVIFNNVLGFPEDLGRSGKLVGIISTYYILIPLRIHGAELWHGIRFVFSLRTAGRCFRCLLLFLLKVLVSKSNILSTDLRNLLGLRLLKHAWEARGKHSVKF